jgi:hypothetical protein
MRRRHKQHQPHVRDRRFRVQERLEADREHDRRPPADPFIAQTASPGQKQQRRERRRDCGWKSCREVTFPEQPVTRGLKPVGERRFVEAISIVEKRNQVVTPLDHLARCFGETRLVAIDQGERPGPRKMEEKATGEEQQEFADCRLQWRIER